MQNQVSMTTPVDSFDGDNGISWKLVPIKVKWVKARKSREVQLETATVGYEKENDNIKDPDPRSWKFSVVHTWVSYDSENNPLTVRNMIKRTYPSAIYLRDLLPKPENVKNIVNNNTKEVSDKSTQTVTRIYTFPVPLPQPLASESITWGEPIVRDVLEQSGELWHARLGHCGDDVMKRMSVYPYFDIPRKFRTNKRVQPRVCECCAKCKAKIRRINPKSEHKATRYLERVHMDTCGPLQMKTYNGNKYFTVFVDEYTRYKWIYLHSSRKSAVEILERFILDATKGTNEKIEELRTDQASEFMSEAFRAVLRKKEIRLQCAAAHDHFQNGRAEKAIQDICRMARCMLNYGHVARDMWGWAVRYAVYIQNRLVRSDSGFSPYEMRFEETPDISRLRVFGCTAYVARDKNESDFIIDTKLDPRGAKGCFLGIAEDGQEIIEASVKGYIVWSLETDARVITSSQVTFDETCFPQMLGVTEWEFSKQTGITKSAVTTSALNFDTERLARHPFVLDEVELEHRRHQAQYVVNHSKLLGTSVNIKRNNALCSGYIQEYNKIRKIWKISLDTLHDDETSEVWMTTEDLVDSENVTFDSKQRLFDTRKDAEVKRETEKRKNGEKKKKIRQVVMIEKQCEEIMYDNDTYNTNMIQNILAHIASVKAKDAPVSRHAPEPKSFNKAMEGPDAQLWYNAVKDEVLGLHQKETWEATPPLRGVKPIDSKWVFKIKYNPDGTIDKYKARLVVRGDSQRAGLDYGEVFSPVAHNTIARLLLSIATACDLECDVVDVCQAFLNATLEEDICMRPAPGVNHVLGIPDSYWLRLKRNLYGLKQAPRNWFKTFTQWLSKDEKFVKASIDDCLYYREFLHNGKPVFILTLVYVDDNIIVSNDRTCLDEFKARMNNKFAIADKGPISLYLGVEVDRDRSAGTLKIHQTGYVNDLLKAMGIDINDKLVYDTPLPAGIVLERHTGMPYEHDLYRSAVGSLIYMSTWTRIDIAYAVSVLAAHMSNPSREHHVALKHLLHYLHGTRDRGITYHKYDIHGLNQIYAFVDADYAGDKELRKSRSGYIVMMNSGAVSWKSKLQTVNAHSTTDAEIYAATAAIKEVAYIRDALRRIGLPQAQADNSSRGTTLYEDNEATCAIARTASHREATKHLAIARYFVRYHHEHGTVCLADCTTQNQLADFLTKSLGGKSFKQLTDDAMGVQPMLSKDKYARRDWRSEYESKYRLVDKAGPDDVPGGMLKAVSTHLSKSKVYRAIVSLIHTNSMLVDTTLTQEDAEYVCKDIDDFLDMERHHDQTCRDI